MPRVVDSQQRRSEVASAARAVIARDGLDGATVRRVAAEAGSSTTVVTHYFANKRELLAAAVEDAYAAAALRMRRHLDGGASGLSGLRGLLQETLPLDAERRAESRVWMAFWAAASVDPDLRQVQRDGYREWRRLVTRALTEDDQRGQLRTGLDVRDEVEHLMCLIDGLLIQATLEPRRLTVARQVAHLDAALDRLRV